MYMIIYCNSESVKSIRYIPEAAENSELNIS
nr:MAG TPA: hypothetical protein [Caudoviricetes sp.]